MRKVDRNQLHRLFVRGLTIPAIANVLGIPEQSCQTIISQERKKDPYLWPLRREVKDSQLESKAPPLMMHLYECTDCFVQFSVEDYETIDQSAVVCPICKLDDYLEDVGYGCFAVTIKAERATEVSVDVAASEG